MTSVIGTAAASDGLILRTRRWRPSDRPAEPRAAILLLHGLGEHSGRYEHVGEQLADAGFDVHAFDLRGSGASAGRRGHVGAFDEYYDDLGGRLAAARLAAGVRPVVLYGHSLGGLIALGYVLRVADAASSPRDPRGRRPLPDLLVLSAPGLDSTIPESKKRIARLLGRWLPTFVISNRLDAAVRSREPDVGRRVDADPLMVHGATAAFGAAALAEQAYVRAALGRLALPTLVIHGEDDRLVPTPVTEPLGALPNVTRRTYPGIRHELHNEPEGAAIIADVVPWIEERVDPPGRPAGATAATTLGAAGARW